MRNKKQSQSLRSETPKGSNPSRINKRFGHAEGYQPWSHLTDEEREVFRKRSSESARAKQLALDGKGPQPVHEINTPNLDPKKLMPQFPGAGLSSLSLFSGGGGLDLGFERAGFEHVGSYEIIEEAAETLRLERPEWPVFGGEAGDVRRVDWRSYRHEVDVVHGGPPCQPFSMAGRQGGRLDSRDMWPEFTRAVLDIEPRAFVAENVPALLQKKFSSYVDEVIRRPLESSYSIRQFLLRVSSFGVPQVRTRVFFVGFRDSGLSKRFTPPTATHSVDHFRNGSSDPTQRLLVLEDQSACSPECMGAREALGLPDIGYDNLAPTIRCSWTGPRGTTSVLSSASAKRTWERLEIWPNGVAADRERARLFVANNGHFRMSVLDCAVLQGFPEDWRFRGPVYVALGQIGNAVPPPLGYHVARAVAQALG